MAEFLALDLGGSFLKAAVLNQEGVIMDKWKVRSGHCRTADDLMACFDSAVKGRLKDTCAICVSCPGRINTEAGILETSGAFESFIHDYPLAEILERRYGLPVSVDNDARCAVNAELFYGAMKGVKNGLVYVIGTGIGGGLIIDGKVYKGSHYSSGEISWIHTALNTREKSENQAWRILSANRLPEMYRERTGDGTVRTGEDFFELANSKDEAAAEILREYCRMHAQCLFTIQTIFDGERIAIGGGISEQPLLIETLKEEMRKLYVENCPSVMPEIVRCQYGSDANLIGAFVNYKQLNGRKENEL